MTMTAKRVAAVINIVIGTTIGVVKVARLPLNWVEIEAGVSGVVVEGRGDFMVEMSGGQSSPSCSHTVATTLPVCDGSDTVSAQEKIITFASSQKAIPTKFNSDVGYDQE